MGENVTGVHVCRENSAFARFSLVPSSAVVLLLSFFVPEYTEDFSFLATRQDASAPVTIGFKAKARYATATG